MTDESQKQRAASKLQGTAYRRTVGWGQLSATKYTDAGNLVVVVLQDRAAEESTMGCNLICGGLPVELFSEAVFERVNDDPLSSETQAEVVSPNHVISRFKVRHKLYALFHGEEVQ